MKVNLTQEVVRGLKVTGKQYYVGDEKVIGFNVRVSRGGTKTFTLRIKSRGQKKDVDLGKVGDLTVSEARKKAERARVELVKNSLFGKSDTMHSEYTLEGILEGHLREECAKRYECAYYWEHPKRTKWPKTLKEKHYSFQRMQEFFGCGFDVRGLTYDAVNGYHLWRSESAPSAANREIAYLSPVMTDLVRRGILQHNPCTLIRKNKEKRTKIALPHSQMSMFFDAVEALNHNVAKNAIMFAVLSGMRPSALLSLQHLDNGANNYIDWEEGHAYLRTHKTDWIKDGDCIVPLSDLALRCIPRLSRREAFDAPWCFPSRIKGKPMTAKTYGKHVNYVLDYTPLTAQERKSVSPYSLRHTFAQTMIDGGASIEDVSFILSHASTQMVKKRYASLERPYARQVKNRTEATSNDVWGKYRVGDQDDG